MIQEFSSKIEKAIASKRIIMNVPTKEHCQEGRFPDRQWQQFKPSYDIFEKLMNSLVASDKSASELLEQVAGPKAPLVIADIFVLAKHDWRVQAIGEICGLSFKVDKKEQFTKQSFEVEVVTDKKNTYAANLVRTILKQANVNVSKAFRFSN